VQVARSDEIAGLAVTGDQAVGLQAWPDRLFVECGNSSHARLRLADGGCVVVDVGRWHRPATFDDHGALGRAIGPVLDIGCGPGRHVGALQARGCEALGIDISPAAVRAARRKGAHAIVASVWDRLPVSGYWQTALLLDGNIGIGGNPVALLEQTLSHLGGAKRIIVELTPGPFAGRVTVQVTQGASTGPWFRWAVVTPSTIRTVARASGLIIDEQWTAATGRSFAVLSPPGTVGQPEAVILERTELGPAAWVGEGIFGWGSRSTLRDGCDGSSVVTADPVRQARPRAGERGKRPRGPDGARLELTARSQTCVTGSPTASRLGGLDG
jgi:SAM-dependent methyltransferase